VLKPVRETLGLMQQVPVRSVFEALKADAATIAERLTPEQKKMLGTAPAATPQRQAMWHDDPAYQEWAKGQRERLNDMAKWAAAARDAQGRDE
jgi:hypothetical protein